MMLDEIKSLCRERHISLNRLEKELGFSQGSIGKMGDSVPKADRLYKIANYFDVPMETFFTDKANNYPERLIGSNASVVCESPAPYGVPVYEVAAGEGRINGTYTDDYVNTDDMTEGYQLCTICGDSMYPVLHDGDTVKVHLQTTVGRKDIAIVKVDGETATAKYIEVVDNGVWLRAENKEVFQDRFYSVQEVLSLPITIIGKVVELRREI